MGGSSSPSGCVRHFREDFGLAHPCGSIPAMCTVPTARGTGGREKAPATICRKSDRGKARAVLSTIEIWGDEETDTVVHMTGRLRARTHSC